MECSSAGQLRVLWSAPHTGLTAGTIPEVGASVWQRGATVGFVVMVEDFPADDIADEDSVADAEGVDEGLGCELTSFRVGLRMKTQ